MIRTRITTPATNWITASAGSRGSYVVCTRPRLLRRSRAVGPQQFSQRSEEIMHRSACIWMVAPLVVVSACSSPAPPPPLPAGALPAGTIDVSIGGHSADRQHGLACMHIRSFTSATAGEGSSSVRAVVDGADELNAVSIQ